MIEGRVARIQFTRPPLNIFTLDLLTELRTAMEHLRKTPGIGVVIFSSSGEHFSSGVAIQDHYPQRVPRLFRTFHAAFRTLWAWDKLSIAEVNGYCLGGGCELALSCDMAVATDRTIFGFPEITVGAFPPIGVLLLPRRIGLPKAMDLVLSGKHFTAHEARQLRLVNDVVTPGDLSAASTRLIEPILKQSPIVLRKTIEAMRIHTTSLIPEIAKSERVYLQGLLKAQDAVEGLDAFLEKRPPVWGNK